MFTKARSQPEPEALLSAELGGSSLSNYQLQR